MVTYKEAFENWEQEIKPLVIAQYGADDRPALSESWNDYTDGLCRDEEMVDLQYDHCPAYDERMPADDAKYILESLGVGFSSIEISTRPDGLDSDFDSGARHYRCLIKRGKAEMIVHYSMGSAHKRGPDLADVVHSLLMDTETIDGATFEDWASDFGYDTDSRKAERMFTACQRELLELRQLFSDSEIEDLRAIMADR